MKVTSERKQETGKSTKRSLIIIAFQKSNHKNWLEQKIWKWDSRKNAGQPQNMQNLRRTWNARSARELTLITSVMDWMKWIWIRLKNSNCAHTACGTSMTKNAHISRKQHSCARNANFITNWRNFTLTAYTRAPLPQTQLWSKYRFRGRKRLKDGHPKQSAHQLESPQKMHLEHFKTPQGKICIWGEPQPWNSIL